MRATRREPSESPRFKLPSELCVCGRETTPEARCSCCPPDSWQSPAEERSHALLRWAAAAGIAGAYIPQCVGALAHRDDLSLEAILAAAARAAEAVDLQEGSWGFRRESIVDGHLTWDTSCRTQLVCETGGWHVSIYPRHASREDAAANLDLEIRHEFLAAATVAAELTPKEHDE